MATLHCLPLRREPPADLRIGRDEALMGLGIGSLDVDDGECAATRHLLMPDGLARDPRFLQRGLVFLPAGPPQFLPRLAISLLPLLRDGNGKHDLGHGASWTGAKPSTCNSRG